MVGAQTTRGNVFVLILIAIVLFGALGMTFSRSASKGTGSLTKYRAKQHALQLTSYAAMIMQAIERLRMKGCALSQISFDGTPVKPWESYVNPNSPADFSCHVFHDNGGKITPIDSTGKDYIDASQFESIPYRMFYFTGSTWILGVDTSARDLIILHGDIKDEICREINNLSGLPNPSSGMPVGNNFEGVPYVGQGFDDPFPGPLRTLDNSNDGITFGCWQRQFSTRNYFYFTLIAR